MPSVRSWHEADLGIALDEVCFGEQTGRVVELHRLQLLAHLNRSSRNGALPSQSPASLRYQNVAGAHNLQQKRKLVLKRSEGNRARSPSPLRPSSGDDQALTAGRNQWSCSNQLARQHVCQRARVITNALQISRRGRRGLPCRAAQASCRHSCDRRGDLDRAS